VGRESDGGKERGGEERGVLKDDGSMSAPALFEVRVERGYVSTH